MESVLLHLMNMSLWAAKMCNVCFVSCSLKVLSASKVLVKHFEFIGLSTSTSDLFTKVLERTIKHSLKSA